MSDLTAASDILSALNVLGRSLVELVEAPRAIAAEPDKARAERAGLLLSPKAAALYCGISSSRLHELRRQGAFPAPRKMPGENADPRFHRDDLDAWAASLPRLTERSEG